MAPAIFVVGPPSGANRNIALDPEVFRSRASGMKIDMSIPDEIFQKAEQLAKRTHRSRSSLVTEAIREYVARHSPDEATEAYDRVLAEIGNEPDPFVSAAARRILKRSEW